MENPNENAIRYRYAIFGLSFILIPFLTIDFISYDDVAAIVNGWALVVIGFILLLYFSSFLKIERFVNLLSYIGLILTLFEVFFVVSSIFPNAYTDEIIIQYYAAKIFLEGKDPYINSNMSGVFHYISPNPIFVTPGLNGRIVNYLLYPGMSVLAFVPAAYFNLPDYTVLFFISALLYVITFLYARKKNVQNALPFLSLLLALDIGFFGFSVGGSTDVLWVFFLVMAYYFKESPGMSGFFYGLSLSSKQISIIMLPFLMYYMFREGGYSFKRMAIFFLYTVFSFILSNLPFIIMGYHQWLRNIIEAEFQPVIGIGVGFSELAFSGFVNISSKVFTIMFLAAIAVMLIVYVKFYEKLKFTFFAFPILIFMFNYRVLMGYVVDWGILIILSYADYANFIDNPKLTIPETKEIVKKIKNTDAKIEKTISFKIMENIKVILLILIIFSAAIGASIYVQSTNNDNNIFVINSVSHMDSPQQIPDVITSMRVNISYNPAEGMPYSSPVFFRIIPNTPTNGDYNGLIWKTNRVIKPGINIINITPMSSIDIIYNASEIRIQAYYEFESNFYVIATNYSNSTGGFSNYNMSFPTFDKASPYFSWNLNMENPKAEYFSYIGKNGINVLSNGFNLSIRNINATQTIIKNPRLVYSISLVDSYVNLSYLNENHYNLVFNYSTNSSKEAYSQISDHNTSSISGIEISLPDRSSIYIIFTDSHNGQALEINNSIFLFQSKGKVNFSQIYNLSEMLDQNLNNVYFQYFVRSNIPGTTYFSAWNFYLTLN